MTRRQVNEIAANKALLLLPLILRIVSTDTTKITRDDYFGV